MAVVTSSSAGARLAAGRAFVTRFPPDTELLIVAPTRGAADDFARDAARRRRLDRQHRLDLLDAGRGGPDRLHDSEIGGDRFHAVPGAGSRRGAHPLGSSRSKPGPRRLKRRRWG